MATSEFRTETGTPRVSVNDRLQPIILASSSPRRHEILSRLGLSFTIDSADVDESVDENLLPGQAAQILALRKAQTVASYYAQGLIIAADTIVAVDGKVLGKPSDSSDALAMLLTLQGREHHVYSGFAVIDVATRRYEAGYEQTAVVFRPIDEAEARSYVATGEPMGKAGSYAIQGLGAVFVKEIHGDYFNVVGLPVFKLAQVLKTFGLDILGAQ
jgi:septum formation protein